MGFDGVESVVVVVVVVEDLLEDFRSKGPVILGFSTSLSCRQRDSTTSLKRLERMNAEYNLCGSGPFTPLTASGVC
jgi:hypothetical protein